MRTMGTTLSSNIAPLMCAQSMSFERQFVCRPGTPPACDCLRLRPLQDIPRSRAGTATCRCSEQGRQKSLLLVTMCFAGANHNDTIFAFPPLCRAIATVSSMGTGRNGRASCSDPRRDLHPGRAVQSLQTLYEPSKQLGNMHKLYIGWFEVQ